MREDPLKITRKSVSDFADVAGGVFLVTAAFTWGVFAGLVALGVACLVAGLVIDK